MADERCVFPGDDSRAPGRWLDRDAAERLLSGEPLPAVDADVRHQADRLAETLGTLSAITVGAVPAGTELPGEAAALAAFRSARTGGPRNGEEASLRPSARRPVSVPSPPPDTSLDAGLVRLGSAATAPRVSSSAFRGRPARHGLAAVLAAGMIGGVAVAATAGVLAFGGGEPEPAAASATAAVAPDRPLRTPAPDGTHGGVDEPRPDGGAGASAGGKTVPRGEAHGDSGAGTGTRPGSGDEGRANRPGQRWARLISACRDHHDGKDLDPGRRHTLEDAARGAERVRKYCEDVLGNREHRDSGNAPGGTGGGHGNAGTGGGGKGGGVKGDGGKGDGGKEDGGPGGAGAAGGPDGGVGGRGAADRSRTGPGTFRSDEGTVRRGGAPSGPGLLPTPSSSV